MPACGMPGQEINHVHQQRSMRCCSLPWTILLCFTALYSQKPRPDIIPPPKAQCLTLFVTHYPSLAELAIRMPGQVACYHMAFMEVRRE